MDVTRRGWFGILSLGGLHWFRAPVMEYAENTGVHRYWPGKLLADIQWETRYFYDAYQHLDTTRVIVFDKTQP